ncbi:MAG: isopenicillin N synthase family oxygenase, partial [Comamonadaceae bacterium]
MQTSTASATLPVIDIAGLRSARVQDRQAVAAQLRAACEQRGFFYISNHGVPRDLVARMFAATEGFFDQPMPAKLGVDKALSACNRGYEPLRAQTLEAGAPPDLKESFYIGNEVAADDPRVRAGRFNTGPNQWP